jgi:2-(1,2-epoxy-1,2-dihydrophenyl)acetyl-CoA isomerase
MSDTVLVNRQDGWVEITLNRPDRLNSFNEDQHLALRAALDAAASDGTRAVLLTGAGKGFCAGQDLGDRDPRKTDKIDLGYTVRTFWAPLVRQIRALEMPVVCAVNGVAAGAGSSLALACDMVIASEKAKFIQSFANVGLIPDTGGSFSLTNLVGPARARGLALTAEPLPAATAEAWGLIWKCLPEDEYLTAAREQVARFAKGPTFGYSQTKKAIQAAETNTMDAQLDLEAELMFQCGHSPDYAEGVGAFLDKRKPEFTGEKPQ